MSGEEDEEHENQQRELGKIRSSYQRYNFIGTISLLGLSLVVGPLLLSQGICELNVPFPAQCRQPLPFDTEDLFRCKTLPGLMCGWAPWSRFGSIVAGASLIVALAGLAFLGSLPASLCPRCRKKLYASDASFCPECGAGLSKKELPNQCGRCHRAIPGRTRNYAHYVRMHFCPQCGLKANGNWR